MTLDPDPLDAFPYEEDHGAWLIRPIIYLALLVLALLVAFVAWALFR